MHEGAEIGGAAPAISVVIPTHNRAEWLPQAVESALAQTLPPAEVVIVDDGSTDDTAAVCRQFPDPVRFLRQERRGAAGARNRGAEAATGDWLAFLDSDDTWDPKKLEIQMAALAETGAPWSITGSVLVDARGVPLRGPQGFRRAFPVFRDLGMAPREFFGRHFQVGHVDVAGQRHTLYTGDAFVPLFYGNFASPATAVIRRELFRSVGGFDERLTTAEDTEFFHRLAAEGPAVIVETPLLYWRVGHGTSLLRSDVEGSIRNALWSLERAAERADPLSEDARAALFRGRRALLRRLAYWQLTELEGAAVRETLRDLREWERRPVSLLRLALWAASLLPRPILRWAGRLKRRFGTQRPAAPRDRTA